MNIETVTADDVVAKLDELRAAIALVEVNGRPLGNAVRFEPAGKVDDPIEVVIAPPSFVYRSNGLGPSEMVVDVFVIARISDRGVRNLIALERGVADAIDSETDASVQDSSPGVWRRGTEDLPAYVIKVSVPL